MDLTVNRSQPHVVLSRGIRTGLSQLSHEVWRLTWPPWEGGWCWTGPVRIYLRYEIPSDNQLCCYLLAGCSFTLSVCKFLFIPQMSLPLWNLCFKAELDTPSPARLSALCSCQCYGTSHIPALPVYDIAVSTTRLWAFYATHLVWTRVLCNQLILMVLTWLNKNHVGGL